MQKKTHITFLAILDRYMMLKKNLYACAIDISKAFDSIIHSHAIFSLLRSGINPFLCRLLWNWYGNASIRVRLGSQLNKSVTVRKGLKQGSGLSPAHFNNALRTVTKNILPFLFEPYIDVSHPCNADDILLLSDDLQVLQNTIHTVCSRLNEIGLQVAPSKLSFSSTVRLNNIPLLSMLVINYFCIVLTELFRSPVWIKC